MSAHDDDDAPPRSLAPDAESDKPLLCPWCQAPLAPWEMYQRLRQGDYAGRPVPVYLACERCAFDMDGESVPFFRLLH